MPVYETAPVVFEIGSAYTKLGYAADSYPRFIIPSEMYDVSTGKTKNLFDFKNEAEFYDQMVDFIQTIFFKYVLVSPKEKKIVIVETSLCPTLIRETLAKVLFRHFDVLSILFVPSHLVVLATLAVETALVVDIGYNEAIVMPVYSGVQVLHAWQAQPLAADAVHKEIKRQLLEKGVKDEFLTEQVIEDIKVRTCFVTTYKRAQKYRKEKPPTPCPDVQYPINGSTTIQIPGTLRETAFEVLFQQDNDNLGLGNIILDAIVKCPIDMRCQLAHSILLIGGTSMAMGILPRLKSELLELLQTNLYKEILHIDCVKFYTAPSKENFSAWLGGSIYAGTDLVQTRALTREAYAKNSHVPDWANLEDNRRYGSN